MARNKDALVFPAGVQNARPFSRTKEAVAYLNLMAAGDLGPFTEVMPGAYADIYGRPIDWSEPPPFITTVPTYAEANMTDDSDWTAAIGYDTDDYYRVVFVDRATHEEDLTVFGPVNTNGYDLRGSLWALRVLKGIERRARAEFDAHPREGKREAGLALKLWEDAIKWQDAECVRAANLWVSTAYADAVNEGRNVELVTDIAEARANTWNPAGKARPGR
jgi:hypothetical protein